jgi:hypothetical protein
MEVLVLFMPLVPRARRAVSASIVVGLLTSLLVLSPSPAHAAASEPAFGTMFHALWSDYSDAERDKVLDKLASANIRWVRVDIGWTSLMENGRGQISSWYLERLEEVVDGARTRGIEVLGTLFLTPGWANGGASKITPPDNAADFGDAAGFLANHFKGRVAAWEVWNEPNHKSFWNGSAADYVKLLKASYPAIKSADPSAQVVLGGPSYNDTDWLSKIYDAGAQGFFDVMSTHPYQGMADLPPEKADDGTIWTLDHVGAVHDLMKAHGDGNKKIWFTEFGWSSHSNWSGVENWDRGVSEAEQADFAIRTLDFLEKEHPYVTHVFWYNERNRDEGDAHLDNYGLLERDLTEKPVFKALREHLTSTSTETPDVTEEPEVEPVAGIEDLPAVEDPQIANLLANGSFERGRDGWSTRDATFRTVTVARDGERSGKIVPRGRISGITSVQAAPSRATGYSAGGYFKARAGQVVRLALVERIAGRVVARMVMKVRSTGAQWQLFPDVALRATGRDKALIALKVRSATRARSEFLVDGLWLIQG